MQTEGDAESETEIGGNNALMQQGYENKKKKQHKRRRGSKRRAKRLTYTGEGKRNTRKKGFCSGIWR